MAGKLPSDAARVLRQWADAAGVPSDTDVADFAVLVLCDITSTGFVAAKRGKKSDLESAQETLEAAKAYPKAFDSAAGKSAIARAEKTVRESATIAQVPSVIPQSAIASITKRHGAKA